MKFLIINNDYNKFLNKLYSENDGLCNESYDKQVSARIGTLFSENNFYSNNLKKIGHEAIDIYVNNEYMQKAWAREHNIKYSNNEKLSRKIQGVIYSGSERLNNTALDFLGPVYSKLVSTTSGKPAWYYEILKAQIEYYQPDVLYNHDIIDINNNFLKKLKSNYKILVGQHAATILPPKKDFSAYRLFISSFYPTIEYFKNRGYNAECIRLGFEPDVLNSLKKDNKIYDITFVGSLFEVHDTRMKLLEKLCCEFPAMKIWGPGIDNLSEDSPIRKCYMGQAWGREMYQILSNSKITINHHGNIPPYANNLRLYEATGVGTLLITDWKNNLQNIFILGKEVVAYKNIEECIELIRYYLKHDNEREEIARAGQERTIKEHNYYNRMEKLANVIQKYM